MRFFSEEFILSQAHWFPILTILWFFAASLNDFYNLRVADYLRSNVAALIRVTVLVFLAYLIIYFFSPPRSLPRGIVLYHGVASFSLVGLWRGTYAFLFWGKLHSSPVDGDACVPIAGPLVFATLLIDDVGLDEVYVSGEEEGHHPRYQEGVKPEVRPLQGAWGQLRTPRQRSCHCQNEEKEEGVVDDDDVGSCVCSP